MRWKSAVALNKRATATVSPAGPAKRSGPGTARDADGPAAARLRVLDSLPRRHQNYFFEFIRDLCARYIAGTSRRDPSIDVRELFNEVMAKLVGVSGVGTEHDPGIDSGEEIPTMWAVSDDPKRDERVAWLIGRVGGQQALKHRHEDIRRRRHGGKSKGDGYRQVQLEKAHIEGLSVEPDDPHHDEDIRKTWRGLLLMALEKFDPGTDVLLLLNLMAHDHEVGAAFGAEWPISQMVSALNRKHPFPPWNDDRVENAKRRLKNWIVRLKRIHGLNEDDLKDLFARRGRDAEALAGTSRFREKLRRSGMK
jgi:hypothetical protein